MRAQQAHWLWPKGGVSEASQPALPRPPAECPSRRLPYHHHPQTRGYEVYRLLEEKVKAMVLALPLVQDLHHPAMRDRHWMMLQKVRAGGR